MPVKIRKKGKTYEVRTPGGIKAKGTTLKKAKAQKRLLNAIEHGFVPRSAKKKIHNPSERIIQKGWFF